MIDTVKIIVPQYIFQDLRASLFKTKCHTIEYINNAKHIKSTTSGHYYPQVVLKKDHKFGNTQFIEIEFSISKLMKGENLLSFRQDIKEAFFKRLVSILDEMGMKVNDINALYTAKVAKIHPCINLIVNCPTELIIEDVSRGYITKKDITTRDFANGGSIVYFHNQFKESALYDKTLDMEQAERKAKQYFDGNDWQNPQYLYSQYLKDLNVLRFEVRLNNREEIRKAFGKDMTLCEVFNDNLIKQVLLSNWQNINKGVERLPQANMTFQDILCAIEKNNPTMTPDKMWQMSGIVELLSNIGYSKTLSFLLPKYKGNKAKVKRLIKEALDLNLPKYKPNYLTQITKGIEAFKPLDIETLKEAQKSYIVEIDEDFNLYDFLTVEEVAKRLKCTPRHIQNELKDKSLKGNKIGKLWRIREKDLLTYLGNRKNQH